MPEAVPSLTPSSTPAALLSLWAASVFSQVEALGLWREQTLPIPSLGGWGRVSWCWYLLFCLAPAGMRGCWGGGGGGGGDGLQLLGAVSFPAALPLEAGEVLCALSISSLLWLSLLFPKYCCPDIWLLKGEEKQQIYWNYLNVILFSRGVSCVKGVSILLTPINIKPLLLKAFAYGKEEDWPLNSLNKANF